MVTRVKIKNFRGIDDLDLELGPLNVLIGPNASGKSNFIEAFRFLQASIDQSLLRTVNDFGGGKYLKSRHNDNEPVEFCIEAIDSHQQEPYSAILTLALEPVANNHSIVATEEYQWFSGKAKLLSITRMNQDSPKITKYDFTTQKETQNFYFELSEGKRLLLPRIRFLTDPSALGKAFPHAVISDIFSDGNVLLRHCTDCIFMSAYDIYSEKKRAREFNRQDDDWTSPWRTVQSTDLPSYLHFLLSTQPETFTELVSWLQIMILNLDRLEPRKDTQGRIDVFIHWKNQAEPIPLDYASDGTFSMLLLGCYLMGVHTNSSIHRYTHLFLDEPDASLHPVAQRLLAEALLTASRQGLQVTIATHSRSFLDDFFATGGVTWDNIIAFDEPSIGRSGPLRFRNLGKDEFAKYWVEKFSLRPSEAWDSGVLGARQ